MSAATATAVRAGAADGSAPILDVVDLKKHFPIRKGFLRRTAGHVLAVDGVSFSIGKGETLGLVGESGCGKSTVGRAILRLIEPTSGHIKLDGADVTGISRSQLRPLRQDMQIIFQDPYSSLNPRMSAGDIVGEPLTAHRLTRGNATRTRVAQLFDRVGLSRAQMANFPHQFSGGQRQRVGIARALALNPKLIIADEPVSALDVSIQAQVINLLVDLQRDLGLSYLFISHNLAVVEHISHRIAVMYLGHIVEYADKTTLFTRPGHPYTEALLSAVPVPDPAIKRKKTVLEGDVPSPANPPPGCRFPHPLPLCGGALPGGDAAPARDRARPARGLPLQRVGHGRVRTPDGEPHFPVFTFVHKRVTTRCTRSS
jgi:oligopeptide/dipeptide ABC transporter ATP-binding protein